MPPPQSYSSSNFAGSGFGASNFGGALFGSAPPPPPPALSMSYAMPMQPNNINMMSQLQSMVRLRGAPAKKAQLFDD
jgi:hypothetical protein